jgi:predicted nucleotidyltransferase
MSPSTIWHNALDEFVAEMRVLYRERLEEVVLYGSRARGDAQEDSDIDTLIVLRPLEDFWAELSRIGEIANRISFEYNVVISAIPVDASEFRNPETPLLLATHQEGVHVG